MSIPSHIHNRTLAHILPLVVFLLLSQILLGLGDWLGWFRAHPSLPWYQQAPEHWIYPLQTLVAGYLVWHFRRSYAFDKPTLKVCGVAIVGGMLGIACWLIPNYIATQYSELPNWLVSIGFQERLHGFEAAVFEAQSAQITTYIWRFIRAVIVVSFVEEICWRGYVMRLAVSLEKNSPSQYKNDLWQVPFGTHSWLAYLITTGAFILVHQPMDWLAAFIYGSLTYLIAIKTKSLSATIIMHATANLIMGIYILQTGQTGLW